LAIDTLLEQIAGAEISSDTTLLRELIAAIRPNKASNVALASDRLRALCFLLSTKPEYAAALRQYLIAVVSERKLVI